MMKPTRRLNYVIACWDGPRRASRKLYERNRSFFLATHLFCLEEYRNKTDQITIVIPYNPTPDPDFEAFVARIPPKVNNAHVEIIRRGNFGLSYGSYAHAFALYGRKFDYYLFNEDDYVYVKDDFDTELIRKLRSSGAPIVTSLHYLHGFSPPLLYKRSKKGSYHTDVSHVNSTRYISNGLTSTEVLEHIHATRNIFSHKLQPEDYNDIHQYTFERSFTYYGAEAVDLTDKYCVPYNGTSEYEMPALFAPDKHEFFVIPLDYAHGLLRKRPRHKNLLNFIKDNFGHLAVPTEERQRLNLLRHFARIHWRDHQRGGYRQAAWRAQ